MKADTLLADKAFDADQRLVNLSRPPARPASSPRRATRKKPRPYDKEISRPAISSRTSTVASSASGAIATRYDKIPSRRRYPPSIETFHSIPFHYPFVLPSISSSRFRIHRRVGDCVLSRPAAPAVPMSGPARPVPSSRPHALRRLARAKRPSGRPLRSAPGVRSLDENLPSCANRLTGHV